MNASRAFKEVPQLPSKQAAEVFGDVHAVVEALSREALLCSTSKGEVADVCEEMISALRDPDALLAHRTAVGMWRWGEG